MFKNIVGETVTGYEIHEGTTNLLNYDALLNIKKGQEMMKMGLQMVHVMKTSLQHIPWYI